MNLNILLHNFRDPFEYNWIDEGAADYGCIVMLWSY